MAPLIENNYVGDGTTILYSFTFEYIEPADVEASLDNVVTAGWTFANATTLEFNTAPGLGVDIRIYRNTTVENPKATFFPGSAIRAQDLNDNFEQILYVTQEADAISERAEVAAKGAEIAADLATAAAVNAEAAGNAAQVSASAAASSAASAASDASTASALAGAADVKATQASSDASAALASSNQAASDSAAAQAAAVSAASDASSAQSDAAIAASVASDAKNSADAAVVTANTATSTAQAAQAVANTANSKADTAIIDSSDAVAIANTAASAVSAALLFDVVQNVAAIPASPANGDAVKVSNSTGIESFSPLTGLPSGFVGDAGINVDIRYASPSWEYLAYSPNDSDSRYAGPNTGVGSAALPSIAFFGDRDTGIFHPSAGAVAVTSNGTVVSQTDSSGVKIGGAVPSSPNISLGSSGSITTAGKITNNSGGYGFPDGTTQTSAPGNGTITITQPGTSNQTFTVNQKGNTTIALKNDTVSPGNGALTIKTAGQGSKASGTFTANQGGNSTLTLPVIRYGDLSGTPSIPAVANNGQINVNAGPGLSASGSNGTANQSGSTTRTLSLNTSYTDGRYLRLSGGSVTGKVTSATTISSDPGDTLATKSYIDSLLAGVAKAWGDVAEFGALLSGLNCTASYPGGGLYTITFATPLPSANYSISLAGVTGHSCYISSQSATAFSVVQRVTTTQAAASGRFSFTVHSN